MRIIRLIVSDVDLANEVEIPKEYRKCYRIPGTNMTMFSLHPFNYLMRFLNSCFMGLIRSQAWVVDLEYRLGGFFFGKGVFYHLCDCGSDGGDSGDVGNEGRAEDDSGAA